MSKVYEKSKFIEYLRETPLVSFACKKVGISRATYYRWNNGDKDFRDQIQKVLRQGRENINDLAEATLIKMIKGENFNATRFWLQNNNKRYVPVRTTYVEPQHDHKELHPGERCVYCGTTNVRTYSSDSEPIGFYEKEIWLDKKKFVAEAKKNRKMSSKEKKALMRKMEARKKGAEVYAELHARGFEGYEGMAEKVLNGTIEPPYIQPKAGEQPKKQDIERGEETIDRY